MKINRLLLSELRPQFNKEDQIKLKAFARFSAKYNSELSNQLKSVLLKNPALEPVLKTQTIDQYLKAMENEHQLQQDAILNEDWDPYITHLINLGTSYARAGLQMTSWFSIYGIFKDCAQEYIVKAFSDDIHQAGAVWSGMNKIIDYALSVLGQSYCIEQNKVKQDEQENKEFAIFDLKESREILQALYENSSDRIYLIDKTGTVKYFNHTSKVRKGDEIVGCNFLSLQCEKDRDNVQRALEKVFTDGQSATYEAETINEAGNLMFAGSIAPILKGGKVNGAAIIARDATKRKKAERQIRKLNERLEEKVKERTFALQAEIEERKQIEEQVSDLNKQLEKKLSQLHVTNQELESFSYTVSHDLRAPLRAIDGFSKVLVKKLEGKIDSSQKHYLEVIIENVGRMGMLIDDLLAFSRMGRVEKREAKFDAKQLVTEVFDELMQSHPQETVNFNVGSLPPLKADREMMKHVFANLLGNALKFSSEMEEIKIEVGAEKTNNGTIYYVKDNGVGFEMDYAHKLFGIFQRLHSDDEFEGTGVGLAIVQRIIQRHDGKVWAEAELDKGATFYFSIPQN